MPPEQGTIIRYRVDDHPEAHDLYWLPDQMRDAMLEGRFPPLPASVLSDVGIHQPTEAIRGTLDDLFLIVERGWRVAARNKPSVGLPDLPFRDSRDFPVIPEEEKPHPLLVGGPLTPLTGIPDRALGKAFWNTQMGSNLHYMFQHLAELQADAKNGKLPPKPSRSDEAWAEAKEAVSGTYEVL